LRGRSVWANRCPFFEEAVESPIKAFNIGKRRRWNPAYKRLQGKIWWIRKKIARETHPGTIADLKYRAKELSEQLRKIPSIDPFDPQYKRMRYLRYADDFVRHEAGVVHGA
jgi:RNA-directed DNA polymerase